MTDRKAAPGRRALSEDLFFEIVDRNYARYQEAIRRAKRKERVLQMIESAFYAMAGGIIATAIGMTFLIFLIATGVL